MLSCFATLRVSFMLLAVAHQPVACCFLVSLAFSSTAENLRTAHFIWMLQERIRLIARRKDRAKERKEAIAMGLAERESWVWEQIYRDHLRLKALAHSDDSDSESTCALRFCVCVLRALCLLCSVCSGCVLLLCFGVRGHIPGSVRLHVATSAVLYSHPPSLPVLPFQLTKKQKLPAAHASKPSSKPSNSSAKNAA